MTNFQTESFEGQKWKPRKKSKSTRPILIGRTRMLRNSTRNSIRHYSTKKIRWSNDLPYAAVHNFGNGTTPARPFMKIGRRFTRALKMKYVSILKRVK